MVHAVRDREFWPGPPGFWDSNWVSIPASVISAADVALWPYTPGLLVEWVSFLGTLHWPAGGSDLGVGGISYLEHLILYELWAGERLSLEKSGKGTPALRNSIFEVEGWPPLLPEFELPRLTGQMLADVVLRKSASAGTLDGWGWRELKVLPVSWYDQLARILTMVW